MSTKTRIYEDDLKLLNVVALKLSAKLERKLTAAEVLHAIFRILDDHGKKPIDSIVNDIKNNFE